MYINAQADFRRSAAEICATSQILTKPHKIFRGSPKRLYFEIMTDFKVEVHNGC